MFAIASTITKFVHAGLLSVFVFMGFYMYLRRPAAAVCRRLFRHQLLLIVLFNVLSFVLIVMHDYQQYLSMSDYSSLSAAADVGVSLFNRLAEMLRGAVGKYLPAWLRIETLFTLLLYSAVAVLMYLLLLSLHRRTNRLLWNCVFMLTSISFVVLWRLDQESARFQAYWMLAGFLVVNLVMLLFRGRWLWKLPAWLFLGISAVFILLPFAFPSPAGGSLNWVSVGPVRFQPSEFVKLSFAFFLAVVYTREKKKHALIMAFALTVFLTAVLLLQRDLGTLLIFGILAWLMTYDYTKKSYVLWGGAGLVVLAGLLAYRYFYHVTERVDIWLNPWEEPLGSGYQILQSLFAIADGGFLGTGLYMGVPSYIPARTTDMIFSVITEEMGGFFAMVLILLYLLMFLFVMETGRRERIRFRRNVLTCFGILLMSQTFIIVGGAIKLIPLTGVTLPFISYGGSSFLSSYISIGIIEAVIRLYRIDREEVKKREEEKRTGEEPGRKEGAQTGSEKETGRLSAFEFGDLF